MAGYSYSGYGDPLRRLRGLQQERMSENQAAISTVESDVDISPEIGAVESGEPVSELRANLMERAYQQAREQLDRPDAPSPATTFRNFGGTHIGDAHAAGEIPQNLSEQQLEQYRKELQSYAKNVQAEAERIAGPQQAALDVWQNAREGVEEANEAAMQDRNEMLAQIEAFEEGYNEDWISERLQREKALLEAERQQAIQRIYEESAARGTTPSPYVVGETNRRMTQKMTDTLQERRIQLEQERAQRKQAALQLRHKTYMGTQREVLDPARATEIVRRLGQASSQVEAQTV